jgi:hypothetical protein
MLVQKWMKLHTSHHKLHKNIHKDYHILRKLCIFYLSFSANKLLSCVLVHGAVKNHAKFRLVVW